MSEKFRFELKEALTKLLITLEEHGQLVAALRKARETSSMLQEQNTMQVAEMEIISRQLNDMELKFNMQKVALDQNTKAQNRLHLEYHDAEKMF